MRSSNNVNKNEILEKIHILQSENLFVCPVCRSPLALSRLGDNAGTYVLGDKVGHFFQISNDVPILTPEHMTDGLLVDIQRLDSLNSFNFQYGKFSWIYEYDCRRVERVMRDVMSLPPENVKGRRVLVVGCGSGAEVEIFRRFGATYVVGFDLTSSIFDAQQKQLLNSNTIILRADADFPPLRYEYFDIVFCDGVLPHTARPYEILKKLVLLKNHSGKVFVRTLIEPMTIKNKIQLAMRKCIREMTRRLPSQILWHSCYFVAALTKIPVLGKILTKTIVYHDVAEDNLRVTQLSNFRKYGDHTFRHHLSSEEVVMALKSQNSNLSVRQRVGLFIAE